MLLSAACGRTGLDAAEETDYDELVQADGAVVTADGALAPIPPLPPETPDQPDTPCVPTPEECNGVDDDCNGEVDELPPIPCPAGGYRYCVAGRLSECPSRCDVCLPGAERVCFKNYCTFWGAQRCAADGRGFGGCLEADPPPECEPIAQSDRNSPELEQCCLDHGYCCVDYHDLDRDGIRTESLGYCEEVLCGR